MSLRETKPSDREIKIWRTRVTLNALLNYAWQNSLQKYHVPKKIIQQISRSSMYRLVIKKRKESVFLVLTRTLKHLKYWKVNSKIINFTSLIISIMLKSWFSIMVIVLSLLFAHRNKSLSFSCYLYMLEF